MHLHFDYETLIEYEANDLLARVKAGEPDIEYKLFIHFLDFISIDSKEFLEFSLMKFKNIFPYNLNLLLSNKTRDICVRDLFQIEDEMLKLSERINQRFNVNFCSDFYRMLLIELCDENFTPQVSSGVIPLTAFDFVENELSKFRKIINEHIKMELPVPLNTFLSIYSARIGFNDDPAIIPAQTFHSLKKSLDEIDGIFDENYDDYITAYHCKGIIDVVNVSMYEIVQKRYQINRCGNCGRYFVPYRRTDTKYCDRPINYGSNKTCKSVGADKVWQEKLKKNESTKLYRNIYIAKMMLIKRSSDQTASAYKKSFSAFKSDTDKWKKRIKEITEENEKNLVQTEYIKRLNEWKSRGGTWEGER